MSLSYRASFSGETVGLSVLAFMVSTADRCAHAPGRCAHAPGRLAHALGGHIGPPLPVGRAFALIRIILSLPHDNGPTIQNYCAEQPTEYHVNANAVGRSNLIGQKSEQQGAERVDAGRHALRLGRHPGRQSGKRPVQDNAAHRPETRGARECHPEYRIAVPADRRETPVAGAGVQMRRAPRSAWFRGTRKPPRRYRWPALTAYPGGRVFMRWP